MHIFGGLSDSAVAKVASMVEEQRHPEGTTICKEGESGRTMYLVREGTVDVLRRPSQGPPVCIVTLGPGECFGEMTLVEIQNRSATIVSRSPVLLYALGNM